MYPYGLSQSRSACLSWLKFDGNQIFICLIGVTSAFLVDVGYYKLITTVNELVGASGEFKKITFWTLILTNDFLIQYIVCSVFLYWFTTKLKKQKNLSILLLLLGVILTDLFLYVDRLNNENDSGLVFPPFFSYSHFFENAVASYLYNTFIWGFIMALALYSMSKLKMKKNKDTTSCYC